MTKHCLIIFFILVTLHSYSQKLIYDSNGNITDTENNRISPSAVRALLANNEKLLRDYNVGRTKKTIGNILLISGPVLLVTGTFAYVISGFDSGMHGEYVDESDRSIPKIIAFAGLAELLIAIPIKIGFSKKIKNVVAEYNNQSATGYNNPKLDLITNSNGIGLRLTLN